MFAYFLKKQLRNRSFLFWSIVFPICLMICFKVAFGNLFELENGFDPVKAVYINEDTGLMGQTFGKVFDGICKEEKNTYFERIKADSAEEAEKLLLSGDAHVLFIARDGKIKTEFSESRDSVDEIIVNSFLGSFTAQYKIIETAAEVNPEKIAEFVTGGLSQLEIAKQKANVYNETPDPYNWYYYSTFIMSIMFNILTGIGIVSDLQADVSPAAMRVSVSSDKKSRLLIAAFMARLVMVSLVSAITLLAMRFGFNIPLGNNIGLLIVLVLAGEIFALACGEVLGLVLKGTVEARENKATGFLMASVFISGEMVATLPGMLEKSAPIINRINPATVLNFAFYKLVYYPDLSGFYANLAKIVGAAVVLLIISILIMRRQRYASV